jgi:AcrR family transcriptional regulator
MSRASRTKPDIRKAHILEAAINLSIRIGYKSITRDAVAEMAGISSGLIGNYFPKMSHLKHAVMAFAIEHQVVEIIAQGLTVGDAHALKINDDLKQKVMQYLSQLK